MAVSCTSGLHFYLIASANGSIYKTCKAFASCLHPITPSQTYNPPYAVASLGFLNKTCTAGTSAAYYGATVGPVLRSAAVGQRWRQWTLRVLAFASKSGRFTASVATYYPPSATAPLCLGNMVAERADGCTGRLADRVHIHHKQPQLWVFTPVTGENNTYTISVANRATGCPRYLGAAALCADEYARLYKNVDGSGRQQWVITSVGPSTPSPTQPPGATPPPGTAQLPPPGSILPAPPAGPPSPPSPGGGLGPIDPFLPPFPDPSPATSPSPIPVPASTPPAPVEDPSVPSSPQNVQATASTTSPTQATLTWGIPSFDGDSAIYGYRASCVSNPGGTTVGPQTFASASTGPGGFINLQPSTSYTCKVAALNNVGPSVNSQPSTLFTTIPLSPTNLVGSVPTSPHFNTATLTWTDTQLTASGISPITSFSIACTPSDGYSSIVVQTFAASAACSGTTCTTGTGGFEGIDSATSYSCTVVGINSYQMTSTLSSPALFSTPPGWTVFQQSFGPNVANTNFGMVMSLSTDGLTMVVSVEHALSSARIG